jgi:hypothetical protein
MLSVIGLLHTQHHRHRWHAPAWWLPQAMCIHQHEGAMNDNTGNGYFGGWQFMVSTWRRAGGHWYVAFNHPGNPRYPFTASPHEQLYRTWRIYRQDGNSFREWGTAGVCGLR